MAVIVEIKVHCGEDCNAYIEKYEGKQPSIKFQTKVQPSICDSYNYLELPNDENFLMELRDALNIMEKCCTSEATNPTKTVNKGGQNG